MNLQMIPRIKNEQREKNISGMVYGVKVKGLRWAWVLMAFYYSYLARDSFLKYWKEREAWIMKRSNVGLQISSSSM